jgi:hypothetical protein
MTEQNPPPDSTPLSEPDAAGHRQQHLYFTELFQLKVQCEYIRRYRDILAWRVWVFGLLRAVASSGGIGGWVIWRDLAFVWGAIIATSQVADAVKDQFPFTARYTAATGLLMDLDALFIETLFEWESVFSGKFTTDHISERRRKLMELQHNLQWKHFPTGDLPRRSDLLGLAEEDAIPHLENMFREGPRYDQN